MQSSDAHLEKALSEYNARISELENGPVTSDLVDALQKRGKVLTLLGYGVSAAEDFIDAAEHLDSLLEEGEDVLPDLCLRTYAALGSVYADDDDADAMREIYAKAAAFIPRLTDPVSCARTCLRCAEDLCDADFQDDCVPFAEAALASRRAEDSNGRNICFEALCLAADLKIDDKQYPRAANLLNEAARLGGELLDSGDLYDPTAYAFCLVNLCECLMEIDDREAARMYTDALSSLLDDKQFSDRIDSQDLSDLHGAVGKNLMELGSVEEAEKHLLRQAAFSLKGDDSILREAIQQKLDGSR